MVESDDRLATMINQIADLNDTGAEYVLLPLLLALPAQQWSSVPHESREELQRLIDVHFTLVTAIPDDCAHNFCENLRISGCRLTHIPLVRVPPERKSCSRWHSKTCGYTQHLTCKISVCHLCMTQKTALKFSAGSRWER